MRRLFLLLLLVCLQTSLAGQIPKSIQTNNAAISGLILDVASRSPIDGAVVTLAATGVGPQRAQRTDPKGRFVFADLSPGAYIISAAKVGYSSSRLGASSLGSGGQVVLNDGQWFRDARLELTRLGGLSGRVTDETDSAVVGALVRLLRPFQINGVTRLAAGPVTKTDDRGYYRFGSLWPGSYFVSVPIVQQAIWSSATADEVEGLSTDMTSSFATTEAVLLQRGQATRRLSGGGVMNDGRLAIVLGNYPIPPPVVGNKTSAYTTTFYPSSASIDGATLVQIGGGEERAGMDLVLFPFPSVHVCGRANSAAAKYSGVLLRLMPKGLEALGTGSEAATTFIGSDGSFCFARVTPGEYTITAPGATFEYSLASPNLLTDPALQVAMPRTPGVLRNAATASGVAVPAAPGIRYATSVSSGIADDYAGFISFGITVGAGDIDGITLDLETTGAIDGTVVLLDAEQTATIGSAEIASVDADPLMGVRFARVRDRRFFARVVRPGNYAIRFGSADLTLVSITANGEDVSRRSIAVRGGSTTAVTVTLSGRPTGLSGTIRDEYGRAVSGGTAILFPVDPALWTNYGYTPTWIQASGSADGGYRITHIRPGEYYVIGAREEDAEKWSDPKFLTAAAATAVRVSISLGSTKTQDVPLFRK